MIPRPDYLRELSLYRDKDLIKVLVGLRRCGKSTILQLFVEQLKNDGVTDDQIISINFEKREYDSLRTDRTLYEYVKKHKHMTKKTYLFFDEIQQVTNFERTIDSLYADKDFDIYLTGSNAFFLSGELATLLSGRYVELKVFPLSFKEYYSIQGSKGNREKVFRDYSRFGGLPYTLDLEDNPRLIMGYLEGVYHTIVRKDVSTRLGAANTVALDEVTRFLFDNVGSISSIRKISDTLTSSGLKISQPTVKHYVDALVEAFILHSVRRYDLKGKRFLQTQQKYYLGDLGLRYYLLGDKPGDVGHLLENIVYLELLRRNHSVAIGKQDTREVDFTVTGVEGVSYYQVAASVLDSATLERELSALRAINDNYPKYLLTLDAIGVGSHEGIQQVNALDWLLEV